jgi:hypothetical protein
MGVDVLVSGLHLAGKLRASLRPCPPMYRPASGSGPHDVNSGSETYTPEHSIFPKNRNGRVQQGCRGPTYGRASVHSTPCNLSSLYCGGAKPVRTLEQHAHDSPPAPSIAPVVNCATRVVGIETIAHRRRAAGKPLLPEHNEAADRVPKGTSHKDIRREVSR